MMDLFRVLEKDPTGTIEESPVIDLASVHHRLKIKTKYLDWIAKRYYLCPDISKGIDDHNHPFMYHVATINTVKKLVFLEHFLYPQKYYDFLNSFEIKKPQKIIISKINMDSAPCVELRSVFEKAGLSPNYYHSWVSSLTESYNVDSGLLHRFEFFEYIEYSPDTKNHRNNHLVFVKSLVRALRKKSDFLDAHNQKNPYSNILKELETHDFIKGLQSDYIFNKDDISLKTYYLNEIKLFYNDADLFDHETDHDVSLDFEDIATIPRTSEQLTPNKPLSRICHRCNSETANPEAKFCWKCGAEIKTPEQRLIDELQSICSLSQHVPATARDKFIRTINSAVAYIKGDEANYTEE